MKFLFIDGEKICVFKDDKVRVYESGYIEKYRAQALASAKNNEWKKKSRTEMLMTEDFFFDSDEGFYAYVHSVAPCENENEILYAFTANDSSGIYLKYLDDEKKTEAHVVSSNEVEFSTIYNSPFGLLATVKKGSVTADIAIFSKDKTDYKCLTGGDSLDENPSFTRDGNILFNSYGVGRDENNEFVGYGASEIYLFDFKSMEVKELITHEEYSYVKPVQADEGFYCIKKPAVEKEKRNVLLEILLIPVRIVQGIVGFVSFFVKTFSGKSLVNESKRGGSMAKNFKKDEGRLFVLNNYIKVDKEMKKNSREKDYGFIPCGWKLVQCKMDEDYQGWMERELVHGVADYCVLEDGNVVYTNGRHIFLLDFKKKERIKLVDVDCCLKVAPMYEFNEKTTDDLFDNI